MGGAFLIHARMKLGQASRCRAPNTLLCTCKARAKRGETHLWKSSPTNKSVMQMCPFIPWNVLKINPTASIARGC